MKNNGHKKPPRLAETFVNFLIPDKKWRTPLGDFEEYYNYLRENEGRLRAWLYYWKQIFIIINDKFVGTILWGIAMFKNYLKITLRNVRKYKVYSFINISGLAVGMACCILILLYVVYELSYDRFHENAGRIYRLGIEGNLGGNYLKYPVCSFPAGPALVKDLPEVTDAVRIQRSQNFTFKYDDKQFREEDIYYVDASFLKIFTFPLKYGNAETALVNANTVVLTEDVAKKYFGNDDPVGKIMKLNNVEDVTVTGVVKNIPSNSHIEFNALFSFQTLLERSRAQYEQWGSISGFGYILLDKNTSLNSLKNKLPAFEEKYYGPLLKAVGGELKIYLEPLPRIHLYSQSDMQPFSEGGNILYVYVFTAIAVFILMIACINFMNLSTARSATRSKEVGLRKVMGAEKTRLIRQFLFESMLYSIISFLIALILVKLALPVTKTLSGSDISLSFTEMPWLIPALLGISVLVGFLAGSYPAFFLSAFQPVKVMKGQLAAGAAGSRFRSILVVAQFVISITLFIGTTVILNQLNYMKNKDMGFHKDNIMVTLADEEIINKADQIKDELKKHTSVVNATTTSLVPGFTMSRSVVIPEGFSRSESQMVDAMNADEDFIKTFEIELVAGRNFSKNIATDADESVIINESAARKFGWNNPIGKKISVFTSETDDPNEVTDYTVIGVVKDFHVITMHMAIGPLVMGCRTDQFRFFAVRIKPENTKDTIGYVENVFKSLNPNNPFEFTFLSDRFNSLYENDERLSKIITYFTIFALFVACLGLFGMASFMAEQRAKEIGIRKTLGASVLSILVLLSKEVTKLIIIANIIAIPLAYYALSKWLERFAYREGMGIMIFILSAVVVFLVGYLTISYQSLKAAFANPVDAIRTE